jgi:ATP-binding cassette, subfamily B, bacterial
LALERVQRDPLRTPPPSIPFAQYKRVLRWIIPYWRSLCAVILLGLVSAALSLLQPYISRWLIDDALMRRDMRMLGEIAILTVALTIASSAVSIASSYLYIHFSARSLFDMRLAVYRHLQQLSPRFFASRKLGDIVSRVNNDVGEVQRICSDTLLGLLANVLFFLGSLAIMLWLNWRLGLLSLALLPIGVFALSRFQSRLSEPTRVLRERSASVGAFLIETLMGIRLVVSSANEEREAANFERHNANFIEALLRMQFISFMASAAPGIALTMSTAAVFLYGGRLVIEGQLTIGALVAFMAYHLRLLSPVQSLMGSYTNLITGGVSLERVFHLLDIAPEVVEAAAPLAFAGLREEIRFDHVSFAYAEDRPVLKDVSFTLPAGALCVLVGPSGVGKSTVADLLLRFFDPDSGSISLDGVDLRSFVLNDLRREVALVEQVPFFVQGSIRENIAYGMPDASLEDIRACARIAQVDAFVDSLPKGYETVLGERGITLSVGERQRIALARALLRDPSLIIMDEPTSALDADCEAAVAEELVSGLRGRTAILITHRMALAEIADIVIAFECGQIVQHNASSFRTGGRDMASVQRLEIAEKAG